MAGNPGIHILLTRPEDQSMVFGAELQAEFGNRIAVIHSPLISVTPVDGQIDLTGITELIFTSINAVHEFGLRSDQREIPCLCVGAKTTKAALELGLTARSANGSADDLIALAQSRGKNGDTSYLHIRGRYSVGDIAETLASMGIRAREQIVYEQKTLNLSQEAWDLLRSETRVIIPLFSPRTAKVLSRQIAPHVVRNLEAIAISRNVAETLDESRFTFIRVARQPTAAAVTREIAAIL